MNDEQDLKTSWCLLPEGQVPERWNSPRNPIEIVRVHTRGRDSLALHEACRVMPDDPAAEWLFEGGREFVRLKVERVFAGRRYSIDVWCRLA